MTFIRNKKLKPSKEYKAHLRFETEYGKQLQFDWKEDIEMYNKYGEIFNFNVFTSILCHINASLHLLAQGGKSFSQIPQKNLLILKKLFDCRDIEQIYRNKPTVVKCAPVIENTRKLFGLLERFNANKADGYAFGGAEAAYLIYPLTDEWALVVIIDGELPIRNALALRSFRERRVGAVKRKEIGRASCRERV